MRIRSYDIPTSQQHTDLSEKSARPQAFGQGYRLGSTEDPWDRNWNPMPSFPDSELSYHTAYMWGRSLDLHRNNGYVAGPSTRLAALVGELVPQFLTTDVEERNALSKLWKQWSKQAVSDGVSSWAMYCETLVGNACQSGDVLCLFDERTELDGPIPLRLNQVDAWLVASPHDKDKDGKKISLGVKKDRGVELGYFVTRSEGGDPYYFPRIKNGRPNAVLFRRPDPLRRPGQSRATPIATPYLNTIKDLWDHERHHARSASSRSKIKAIAQAGDVMEIRKAFQAAKQADDESQPDLAKLIRQTTKTTYVETPDATTLMLPKHVEYKSTPTDTVDSNFPDYKKSQLQDTAPGWGIGHEIAYFHMDEANFARARIHFMQAGSETKRWIRDIGTLVGEPLIKLFVQYAWAYGFLKKDPTPEATLVEWHGLPVEYMDLAAEVQAYGDGQITGVLSPQGIARRSNTDWESTLLERMEYARKHRDLMKKFELTDQDLNSAFGERKDAPTDSTNPQESTP